MTGTVRLQRLVALPAGLEALRAEARGQGFRFLDRLAEDWEAGRDRFDRDGERLFCAWLGAGLVGIGGLSRDPSERFATGRLRHLYVLDGARRRGIGSMLVRRLLAEAAGSFERIRLRTDTAAGADFYLALGFAPVASASATHELRLGAGVRNLLAGK